MSGFGGTAAVVIALAVAAGRLPAHAAAPNTVDEPVDRRLPAVDVDMADDATEAELREELSAWLGTQEAEITKAVGPDVGVLTMAELRDFDAEQGLGYSGVVKVRLVDARLGGRFEVRVACPCSPEEFFATLGAALNARVREWVQAPNPDRSSTTPRLTLEPTQQALPSRPRSRIGTLGIVGGVVLGIGAASIAGGAVMWRRGVEEGQPPSRDGLGRAGVVAVAGGVAVAAAGVWALVADGARQRRTQRTVRPVVALGDRAGAVGLRGRF